MAALVDRQRQGPPTNYQDLLQKDIIQDEYVEEDNFEACAGGASFGPHFNR